MQQELIEILEKEGKRKESSFTLENTPMDETTTIARIFRQEGPPPPFSRHMVSSTTLTSQRPNTLPKRFNIHSQASSHYNRKFIEIEHPLLRLGQSIIAYGLMEKK
ncbi:hypothetical protein O181_062949 [Austropuccinia psidii MF-1]|uniref:Uncharacterized protein n=1 Tax=Austropuccinia psidii MF-1 TaxID=1389203 RepID=A0A9Q3ELE6_9BASI|nr:hypothetical protein [Austropuccinia psidii MF-1]